MIGTDYTPGLLAALAKTPHLRGMEVPATPNGQRVASYTKRYTDEWECTTTLFDADDAELVSFKTDCGADGSRFGFALDHNVEKVAVSSRPGGLCVVEETHIGSDTVTSFFEDETSDEPWLVIVEPD